jgi:hypothetical protein
MGERTKGQMTKGRMGEWTNGRAIHTVAWEREEDRIRVTRASPSHTFLEYLKPEGGH